MRSRDVMLVATLVILPSGTSAAARRLESGDLLKLRTVRVVRVSPDGARVAYAVSHNDRPGRPYCQLHVTTLADGKSARVSEDVGCGSTLAWSPDSSGIAFEGKSGEKSGLHLVRPDGSGGRFLAEMKGTNSPLTHEGASITWSPDGRSIAFVSTTPGPETAEATGDPVVITRYKYKPDFWVGDTRFSDNRRRHIFIADVQGGQVRPLTPDSIYDEHSIDWSPKGDEIVCVSNREPDPDFFYNPDLFAVRVSDGTLRRLTATESAEFQPRWSPDGRSIAYMGTKRGLTDLETDMEDTHVWLMNADGSGRRELGAVVDNRQTAPAWSRDGAHVYFTSVHRGTTRLLRLPVAGGASEVVVGEPGTIEAGGWSVGRDGLVAYAFNGLGDVAQLFVRTPSGARPLTDLNAEALRDVERAKVEAFTFVSHDFRFEVEAFLTRPLGMTAGSRHPMIVMIHGGPHDARGPAFNFRSQFYAARGWATLQVNFRGSTSYGQAFSDAVFADQNGGEAQDVLYGVSAALRRNPWIDRERLGVEGQSYGGQLSFWLTTQTRIFKAAIPLAGIANNLSYNYMTYYNMYEEMEWGAKPHQGNLMDVLWERSALKHVAKVATPTLIVHGENDNDVPIAESEQWFVALKDLGVDTVFVRYPREGHGLRESKHLVDLMDRSAKWYERYFAR